MNPFSHNSETSPSHDEDFLALWNSSVAANVVPGAVQPKDPLNGLHATLTRAAQAFLLTQQHRSNSAEEDDKTVTSSASSKQSAGNIPKPKRPR